MSPTLTGVEDILLAGLGDGEDDEPWSGLGLLAGLGEDDEPRSGPGDTLLGTAPSFDWLFVLYKIEVSGEFTPESVEV